MELYQHQKDARVRFRHEKGANLFWQPGCGKTCGSLAMAVDRYKAGEIDVLLIVAPNRIHTQWAREQIPTWCGNTLYADNTTMTHNSNGELVEGRMQTGVRYNVFVQYKKNKKPLIYKEGMLNILCVNIETFSTQSYYEKFVEYCNAHKTMIILDEATVIKNPGSTRTERLLYAFNDVVRRGKRILSSTPKTVMRVNLTGTPVTESPFDLWSICEFLYPNYFNCNYYAFKMKHGMFQTIEVEGRRINVLLTKEAWEACKKMTYEQAAGLFGISLKTFEIIQMQETYRGPYIGLDVLKEQIDRISSFVKIEDIADMPDKVYNKRILDMSDEQREVYKDMQDKFVAYYAGKTVDAKAKVTVKLRLQQIASGFITSMVNIPEDATDEEVIAFLADPPPREVTWFSKMPKVDQLVADLEELGHEEKAVILTHFTAEAAKLYDILTEKGFSVNLQTGWKKVGTIESFKAGTEKIMVANTRVVSKGFNFQANCNHLYYYSNTFSLEDRIQSEARIYRLGQSKTCIYTDYCMKDTVDEDVWNKLKNKKETSDYFWSDDSSSEDDLVEMPVF